MKNHRITGGGGVQLNLVETGNPNGRPILFIHGFSQSWRVWNRQLNSDLTDDCRLVAMDIRGHGLSDKPREGYAESRLWLMMSMPPFRLSVLIIRFSAVGPTARSSSSTTYGITERVILAVLSLSEGLRNWAARRQCPLSLLSFSTSLQVSFQRILRRESRVSGRCCECASPERCRLRIFI